MKRVLVLADEANLMAQARRLGRRMDWAVLREGFAGGDTGRVIVEFIMYIGLPPSLTTYKTLRANKLRFVDWCQRNGFLVVTKDGYPTEAGRYKANVDVLMAIDGTQLAYDMRPDVVVLCTGDGDFAHLALTLRRRGIRVEVAAPQDGLASALASAANQVLDLTALFSTFKEMGDGAQSAPAVEGLPAVQDAQVQGQRPGDPEADRGVTGDREEEAGEPR